MYGVVLRMLRMMRRMITVEIVDTTGVIYVEVFVKGRLDHLSMNVLTTQVFLRAFLAGFRKGFFKQVFLRAFVRSPPEF